jgi:hypothetical protein
MRRAPPLVLFSFAALCWLAAGPGGVTVQALAACRHDAMHQSHPGHGGAPAGPCFCDEMTGGSDLAVSTAVPTPPGPSPDVAGAERVPLLSARFPLPPSPVFAPTPPPPNGRG